MMSRSHLAAGTAAALFVIQPPTLSSWVLCMGAASIGSVICDIDSGSSKSRKKLNQITAFCILVILAVLYCEYRWKIGITYAFLRQSSYFRLISGFLIFLLVCNYGKKQPHRSFMHSFLGSAILAAIVFFIHPKMGEAFAVAMGSHIALDLLNRKRVRLFYPIDRGLCFHFCASDGLVCRILFSVGTFGTVLFSMILFLTRYIWEMI